MLYAIYCYIFHILPTNSCLKDMIKHIKLAPIKLAPPPIKLPPIDPKLLARAVLTCKDNSDVGEKRQLSFDDLLEEARKINPEKFKKMKMHSSVSAVTDVVSSEIIVNQPSFVNPAIGNGLQLRQLNDLEERLEFDTKKHRAELSLQELKLEKIKNSAEYDLQKEKIANDAEVQKKETNFRSKYSFYIINIFTN